MEMIDKKILNKLSRIDLDEKILSRISDVALGFRFLGDLISPPMYDYGENLREDERKIDSIILGAARFLVNTFGVQIDLDYLRDALNGLE